jgi:2-alkyl-3-oxoalkanoate reductase
MTILVTGATGFLGSHVAEQLSAQGATIRALVRKTSDTAFLRTLQRVEFAEGSIGEPARLAEAMVGIDAVIHVAGIGEAKRPEVFHETNVVGTANMVAATAKHGSNVRRFVLVSSLGAMGPSDDGTPLAPDAPPHPVTHYGRSKLAGERAALALKDKVPLTIVRPPAIYGPRDAKVLAFFKAVRGGVLPQLGSSDRRLSMIYGPDCARACIAATEADVASGSAYYVEDGERYRFGDLVAHIETALDTRARFRFPIPAKVIRGVAWANELRGKATGKAVLLTRDKCNELFAPHWVCDAAQTRHDLEWTPEVTFGEGAQLTARWYRAQGWL